MHVNPFQTPLIAVDQPLFRKFSAGLVVCMMKIAFYAWRASREDGVLQGLVAQRLVSANRWLRGIKTYRFPWYLTLVSANHASSNSGQEHAWRVAHWHWMTGRTLQC